MIDLGHASPTKIIAKKSVYLPLGGQLDGFLGYFIRIDHSTISFFVIVTIIKKGRYGF
jgi:hypothetical protein